MFIKEVKALIAEEDGQRRTRQMLPAVSEPPPSRNRPEQRGEWIGGYELLEELGDGGFATVWMAAQVTPVRRKVALKILKMGMDTAEVIARFDQERQALALMDHPNIAHVFDAGATPWGRPYFVMELVNGLPITRFCDDRELGTRDRLALFADVCAAINHAHQKGIIHRDIKPSNVMVTVHGEKPTVKVIDFGIAKATQGRLTKQTLYTRVEQFIGTPAYMSPEQASGSGMDIDTRSDIYALGILLYELLTGQLPFDSQCLASTSQDQIRRIIREVEPPKPSLRLSATVGAERSMLARARRTEPAKLNKFIEPDLDWIVMKAIEKDRSRRYATANGLAADIRRFLAGEPIVARPPTIRYQLQKTWQRNKLVASAGITVFLALIVGIGLALWQAKIAGDEKDIASAQSAAALEAEARAHDEAARALKAEASALLESARARQTAQFLTQLLDNAAEEIKKGRNPEALKRAFSRSLPLLDTLHDDPVLQRGIVARLSSFHRTVGEWKIALELMETELELTVLLEGAESRQAHEQELEYLEFVDDHGDRVTVPPRLEALKGRVTKQTGRGSSLWFAVQTELIRCWVKLRSPARALVASAEAVAEAERQQLGDPSLMHVHLMRVLALESARKFEDAEALLSNCRERARSSSEATKWLAQIDERLLYVLEAKGDYTRGADILREKAARLRTESGDRRHELVPVLTRLAKLESKAGMHEKAIETGEAALALALNPDARSNESGDTFRAFTIEVLRQLAQAASAAGRHEDAIRRAGEALLRAEEQGSIGTMEKALQTTAEVQTAAGRYEEAYRTHEKRNALRQDSAINYRTYVETLLQMSDIRLKQGRPAEAVEIASEMWKRSTDRVSDTPDPGHLQCIAHHSLKAWSALQKAQPERTPPVELDAWRAAVKYQP